MAWISRLSIRVKAPIAAAALILIVGVAISTAAFLVIRRTLHDRASDRLTSLAAQYRETFRANMAASRARATAAARQAPLAAYLSRPSRRLEPAALEALRPRGPQPELAVRTELRDENGRLLLQVMRPDLPDAVLSALRQVDPAGLLAIVPSAGAGSEPEVVGFGKFQQAGKMILYPTVARIAGAPDGYYVNWRRLADTSQARTQIAGVLGSEAAFYLLNADGGVWSDVGQLGRIRPGGLLQESENGSRIDLTHRLGPAPPAGGPARRDRSASRGAS